MNVRDIVPIFCRVKPNLVGGPMNDTSLDAAPCQPGTEPLRVMISSIPLRAG